MRKMIIRTLEGLSTLAVIGFTIMGFLIGGAGGGLFAIVTDSFGNSGFSLIGAVFGAVIGFTFSALMTGVIFLLLNMNEHIEKMAVVLEWQKRQAQQALEQPRRPAPEAFARSAATVPLAPVPPAHAQSGQPTSAAESVAGGNRYIDVACPGCGMKNRGDRNVCWSCGAALHHTDHS